MLNLGTVRPGSTIRIPFHTFDSNDPSASVTITGLAVTDIEVYKDGGTTQRASDAGYSLLDTDGIDFDLITGIHAIEIDLSDNTTAGFWAAGSSYWVVVSSITVDAATVNFVAATFTIGYDNALVNTTIATLASQTSFTLSSGSADNDAYNGWVAVIHDVASAVQLAVGYVSDYVGLTKTVTLAADPAIFTMAAADNISLFHPAQVGSWNTVPLATTNPLPNAAADAAGGLPISDAGGLDLDAIKAETDKLTLQDAGAGVAGSIIEEIENRATPADLPSEPPTAAANADAVWDEAKAGHVGAGSFGEEVQGHALTSEVAAVETDTQDIQSRLPAALVGGRIDADIGAKTGNVPLSAQEKLDVNAEADAALDTAIPELATAQPPATPTMRQAVMFRYMTLRNKRITTKTQDSIHNDAGTKIAKATLTGTASAVTKEKFESGP